MKSNELIAHSQFSKQLDQLELLLEVPESIDQLVEIREFEAENADPPEDPIATAEIKLREEETDKIREIKSSARDNIVNMCIVMLCALFESYLRRQAVELFQEISSKFDSAFDQKVKTRIRDLETEFLRKFPWSRFPENEVKLAVEQHRRRHDKIDSFVREKWKTGSFNHEQGVLHMFAAADVQPFTFQVGFQDNPFESRAKMTDAYLDIRLMYLVRHQIVHRIDIVKPESGTMPELAGKGSSLEVADKQNDRYAIDFDKIEFNRAKVVSRLDNAILNKGIVPSPGEIIYSNAVNPENDIKYEDFFLSTRRYARYIFELSKQKLEAQEKQNVDTA